MIVFLLKMVLLNHVLLSLAFWTPEQDLRCNSVRVSPSFQRDIILMDPNWSSGVLNDLPSFIGVLNVQS